MVHRGCFTDGWTAAFLAALLADSQTIGCVARTHAGILGVVLCRVVGDELEVLTLAVAVAARRRGLARRMLSAVLDEARKRGAVSIVLEVAADNAAARALYAGLGLSPVGIRRGYYTRADGAVDALVMRGRA